jgi:methylase of polypeptide subunit release factors
VSALLATKDLVVPPSERPPFRRRLRDDSLSSLVRLFLLHEPVEAAALAPLDPAELPELLVPADGRVVAAVAIQQWRDLLVCHDWPEGPPAADFVVPVSHISALLADLTVRRSAGHALDLGTGSGVQALLAARHAERVVAADVSPRALQLAAWSLALSGVESVDLREGSLFETVADEAFDLIVSNPPFIVSPDRALLFRDAEPEISRRVVEGAADRVRDGGFAHVLGQWPLASGEEWDEQPRAWVANRGCDAWLLRVAPDQDPVDYSASWNRYPGDLNDADFEHRLERWVTYFADTGIAAVASGLVILRRREGRNWTRSDVLHDWPSEPAGEHVSRVFDGQTLVESLERDAFLDLVLTPAAGLRVDETRQARDGGLELVAATVRLPDGLSLRPRLSRTALDAIARLDGRQRLRDLDAGDAVPHLRELAALGFLRAEA